MTFRDDHEALLAQADALRRDLADAEARLAAAGDDDAEIATLRAQVERLREENQRLQPAPAPPPPPRVEPPTPAPAPGSLLKPLIDTTPKGKPDRTGFLYVVFIALALIGFIALGISFL